jgi:hypothetical protein
LEYFGVRIGCVNEDQDDPADTPEDDSLTSDLLESNPEFQKLVAKSKASPRKPFRAVADE